MVITMSNIKRIQININDRQTFNTDHIEVDATKIEIDPFEDLIKFLDQEEEEIVIVRREFEFTSVVKNQIAIRCPIEEYNQMLDIVEQFVDMRVKR